MHIGRVLCLAFLDKCPLPSLLSSVFNHSFTAHTAVPNSIRKIVPIPATASANTSISYDEDGNIHVRPFDDEDLFVED